MNARYVPTAAPFITKTLRSSLAPCRSGAIKFCFVSEAIEPRRLLDTNSGLHGERQRPLKLAGARETMEEANASVENPNLYTVFSLPHISQVYMFFKAELVGPSYSSGPESLEVALFSENDIPWDELAFPVITKTLKHYFSDPRAQLSRAFTKISPFVVAQADNLRQLLLRFISHRFLVLALLATIPKHQSSNLQARSPMRNLVVKTRIIALIVMRKVRSSFCAFWNRRSHGLLLAMRGPAIHFERCEIPFPDEASWRAHDHPLRLAPLGHLEHHWGFGTGLRSDAGRLHIARRFGAQQPVPHQGP